MDTSIYGIAAVCEFTMGHTLFMRSPKSSCVPRQDEYPSLSMVVSTAMVGGMALGFLFKSLVAISA